MAKRKPTLTPKRIEEKVSSAERRIKALAMRRDGLSQWQIAQDLGVATSTISTDISLGVEELPKEALAEARAIELERLDRCLRRNQLSFDILEKKVKAGDIKAIEATVKVQASARDILEKRAKILGLYKPVEVNANVNGLADFLAKAFE